MHYRPVPESRWRPVRREGRAAAPSPPASRAPSAWPWRALLGLALVYGAIALGLYLPWVAVLIWWAISDLRRGQTWFMEPVRRATQPFVFWLLLGSWVALSVLMVGLDILSLMES